MAGWARRANCSKHRSSSTAWPASRIPLTTELTAVSNRPASRSEVNRSMSWVGRSTMPCSRIAPEPASRSTWTLHSPYCPGAMSAKRLKWPWKPTVMVRVGPFRCLAMMRSASPARGLSFS